jgi:bile acid:Na+ symporter, BASS family
VNVAGAQDFLVILLNVSVMLAMGLDLTLAQLHDTLRRPAALASGMLLNLLLVPLLAAGTIHLFALPAAAALGFLLCAAAAGGSTGPLLTANARGDVAYSVALVVLLSFASVPAVPLLVHWLGGAIIPGNGDRYAGRIIGMILLWQIAPLCAGMLIRHWHANLSRRLHVGFKALGNLTLLVLTLGLLILKSQLVLAHGWMPLVACALFVCITLGVGSLVARPSSAFGRALMFSTGIRNLSLALLLASQVFTEPATMLTALAYGLFMFGISLPLSFVMRRRALA